jgi:hypothetical protein
MFTIPVPVPVTTPAELTVATVGVPLVHEPPEGVPVSVIADPTQRPLPPEIASGGFTVNEVVA